MRQKPYLKKKTDHLDENKSSEGWFKTVLQYSAFPIALLSSIFYLFGRIYYENFLSYWGLSESLFPLSRDQSVISGFLRFIIYGVSFLSWLSIILWICLAVVVVIFISCYRPVANYVNSVASRLRGRAVAALRTKALITESHDRVMNAVTVIIGGITIVVVLILLFAYSCSGISSKARENARKEHNKMLSGTESSESFTSRAVLYVRNETKGFDQYSGHLIQTSTTHCALYSKASGISIFPTANVSRMVIRENKVKQ